MNRTLLLTLSALATNTLWADDVAGSAARMLNESLTDNIRSFQVTPDSARVLYRSQQDGGSGELFGTPLAGGLSTKLSPSGDLVFDDVKITSPSE